MSNLKKYREKAKLTQVELAALCGWDKPSAQSRVGNYENSRRTPPLDDIRLMVNALNRAGVNCTVDDVFPPRVTAA